VLHAALDAVDEAMWLTKEPHLKVDRWAAAPGSSTSFNTQQREHQPCPLNRLHFHGSHSVPGTCALQTVDRFNNLLVTAFVTPGNARFLLLHDGRSDDSIRAFFSEVYELYLRVRAGSCVLHSTGMGYQLTAAQRLMPRVLG
jgi:hypothetical protein